METFVQNPGTRELVDCDEIQKIVEKRKIKYLYHFTQLENLDNILKKGLCSRSSLKPGEAQVNDSMRLDNLQDTISISIGFPNYKMFYLQRQKKPDAKWVILMLKSSILYELPCLFCEKNAASSDIRWLSVDERRGAAALEKMFPEESDGVKRHKKLSSFVPTNPQAEVLVFEHIPVEYIHSVVFKTDRDYEQYEGEKPNGIWLDIEDPQKRFSIFGPRFDYKDWEKVTE